MAVNRCCKLIYLLIKVGFLSTFRVNCNLFYRGFLPPSLLLYICTIFKCVHWLLLSHSPFA